MSRLFLAAQSLELAPARIPAAPLAERETQAHNMR